MDITATQFFGGSAVILSVLWVIIRSNSYTFEAPITGFLSICAWCVFVVLLHVNSESYQKDKAEEQAKWVADHQPRITQHIDGCDVWAFYSNNNWHYLTKCPDGKVTTDTTIEERHGKSHTTRIESIVTGGGK